jgi:ribonuclease P/MRP protein subunit RPP1
MSRRSDKTVLLTHNASSVGYNVVAFNHVVVGKFDPARHINPFVNSHQSHPPFPELDPRRAKVKQQDVQVTQLSRMTLILNDDSMGKVGHGMTAQSTTVLLGYDLLAAQAYNDASFSLLCLTLSELKPASIDIITLDLSSSARLPFFLKRSTVHAAIANGVVFEICYSKMVQRGEGEDSHSRARRNIISAARDILRVTNGKNVIFSSGAFDILGLRGPYDVINL